MWVMDALRAFQFFLNYRFIRIKTGGGVHSVLGGAVALGLGIKFLMTGVERRRTLNQRLGLRMAGVYVSMLVLPNT